MANQELLTKPPPPPPIIKGSLVAMAWKAKLDLTTGRTFYYNARTKASVWSLPSEVLDELARVRCFKCNREVEAASVCPVCLVDPNPDSPTSFSHIQPPESPKPPVENKPPMEVSKQAPVKFAPRRNTGAGLGAFVRSLSRDSREKNSPDTNLGEVKTANNLGSPKSNSEKTKTFSAEWQERQQVHDENLPAGWIAIQDKSTNSLYYFHSQTQEVTWTRPELERVVVKMELPHGWIAIKDASTQGIYYHNQDTQEVTWEKPEEVPPPPDEPPTPTHTDSRSGSVADSRSGSVADSRSGSVADSRSGSVADSPFASRGSSFTGDALIIPSPILRIRPAALLLAKSALVEVKSRDSAHLQGLSVMESHFINEVLRPKYGDGQLLKDPALLETLFAQMINHEPLRKVIFCEFFLSCFRQEPILQAMLRRSSWKTWILALISDSTETEMGMLDYVLMTLIEMFAYFFHRYSEKEGIILGTTDCPLGISPTSPTAKSIVMYDFLVDAAVIIIKQASMDVCLKVLSGMLTKIASWGAMKPPWTAPSFLMPQWQNLFSSLEAMEDCMFFVLPSREFFMPDGPLFPGMPLVDAIIGLLDKLKVRELEQGVETDGAMLKLQKLYASKGVQELEFFRGIRDFFIFHSDLGCMEKHKAGFHVKSKPPPRCSSSDFCHLLLGRKRVNYGTKSQVLKKIEAYVAKVSELYSKVFAGQVHVPHLQSPSRAGRRDTLDAQPRRATLESSSPSAPLRTLVSSFTRQQSSTGRKLSLDIPQRPSSASASSPSSSSSSSSSS